jgi:hypothetical protein
LIPSESLDVASGRAMETSPIFLSGIDMEEIDLIDNIRMLGKL